MAGRTQEHALGGLRTQVAPRPPEATAANAETLGGRVDMVKLEDRMMLGISTEHAAPA